MMRRATVFTIALAALLLACVAFLVAMRPRCECVLGAHYANPVDPADCAVHGAEEE